MVMFSTTRVKKKKRNFILYFVRTDNIHSRIPTIPTTCRGNEKCHYDNQSKTGPSDSFSTTLPDNKSVNERNKSNRK